MLMTKGEMCQLSIVHIIYVLQQIISVPKQMFCQSTLTEAKIMSWFCRLLPQFVIFLDKKAAVSYL